MRLAHFCRTAALVSAGFGLSLYAQVDRVPAGTQIVVRTIDSIDAKSPSDSRIYTGTVDQDVMDTGGRTVIPRGSNAELIMRDSTNSTVVLDLESVEVGGRRYVVSAPQEVLTTDENRKEGVGTNKRTAKYVGGGAVLGSIIGAIAGGGKGAAIGAAAGAGAGAVGQTVTRGNNVKIPSESVITFRLDRPMMLGAADNGYSRDGYHYHRYDRYSDRDRYEGTRSRQNDR